MVPAYVGYLLANVLTGTTRSWIMGQRHCVAAIEAVNVLVGNMSSAQKARYSRSEEGLTRLSSDFYSYAIAPAGRPHLAVMSMRNDIERLSLRSCRGSSSHTRPEPMTILRRIDGGQERTRILGYRNRGGTLDVAGMLFANGCTWAHVLHAAAQLLAVAPDTLLDSEDCRN